MSHQAIISYEGVSIALKSQCDTAAHSLCRIDKEISYLKENAKSFQKGELVSLEKSLLRDKETLTKSIEEFKVLLERYRKMTTSNLAEYQRTKKQLRQKALELQRQANELTGMRIDAIHSQLNERIQSLGGEDYEAHLKKIKGMVQLDSSVLEKIDAIEDEAIKMQVYDVYLSHTDITSVDELKKLAAQAEKERLEAHKEEIIESHAEDLREQGVSASAVESFKEEATQASVEEINESATNEANREKARRETLVAIVKAIRKQGFLVDAKKGIKLDEKTGQVKVAARKIDGKKADFSISLDGKFMYHFDGYEGSACHKNMEPFLEDLKNIYGINILHEEVISSNPDKIQMQHHQRMDSNKGKK